MADGAGSRRVRSIVALSLVLVLSACGGETRSGEPAQTGGATAQAGGATAVTGGAPAQAGTGQGGMGAVGGSGEPEPDSPIAGLKLDDSESFFWVLATPTEASRTIEPEMEADGNPVLHLGAEGEPAQATLSTHHHFEVVRYTSRIEFSAKSSEPLSLLVSVRRSVDGGGDYFAALAAGESWPTATVEVGTDWRGYSVPFSAMRPADNSDSGCPLMACFMIAFIVEHPESVDVWFDDVRVE